jgi:N-acetylglucosaminyldiphosphoundecaprenol N-acetyl-beta-D-mannosaminyltransferase
VVQVLDPARIPLFGIGFDALHLSSAASKVLSWTAERQSRVVVTPNVDHIVQISERPELRAVYNEADLVLADGQPLIWVARMLGSPLPERVAGSDLFPLLLRDAVTRPGLRVFLFGGKSGVAERAAENIERDYPWVKVVGTHAPPLGFEARADQNGAAVAAVAAADADIVLLALGAPKQELWAHRERSRLNCGVVLCLGATVDFMAGTIPRAPTWMRRAGLEWLFRIAGEPQRLAKRYVRDAAIFPKLVLEEAVKRSRSADAQP